MWKYTKTDLSVVLDLNVPPRQERLIHTRTNSGEDCWDAWDNSTYCARNAWGNRTWLAWRRDKFLGNLTAGRPLIKETEAGPSQQCVVGGWEIMGLSRHTTDLDLKAFSTRGVPSGGRWSLEELCFVLGSFHHLTGQSPEQPGLTPQLPLPREELEKFWGSLPTKLFYSPMSSKHYSCSANFCEKCKILNVFCQCLTQVENDVIFGR